MVEGAAERRAPPAAKRGEFGRGGPTCRVPLARALAENFCWIWIEAHGSRPLRAGTMNDSPKVSRPAAAGSNARPAARRADRAAQTSLCAVRLGQKVSGAGLERAADERAADGKKFGFWAPWRLAP